MSQSWMRKGSCRSLAGFANPLPRRASKFSEGSCKIVTGGGKPQKIHIQNVKHFCFSVLSNSYPNPLHSEHIEIRELWDKWQRPQKQSSLGYNCGPFPLNVSTVQCRSFPGIQKLVQGKIMFALVRFSLIPPKAHMSLHFSPFAYAPL